MKKEVKGLPKTFIGKGEVKGFEFIQLKRSKKAALYEVQPSYGKTHFEVFRIKTFKTPKTNNLYESYPKANSFGNWAWTYNSIEKAEIKFKKIEDE